MPRARAAVLGGLGLILSASLRHPSTSFSAYPQTTSAGARQIQRVGRGNFVNALPKSHAKYRKHLVKAGDAGSAEDSESAVSAVAGLVGGAAFWGFMYWLFFKAIATITKLVQGKPQLEIASFVTLSLFPLLLVRRGVVSWGVDRPLKTLARFMPTPGLRHIVKSAIPGMHNIMTGLLLFFAVNLLTAAVPASFQVELPNSLKAMDPDGNGILTGTELETVVEKLSIQLLSVVIYLETGLFGLSALAKPKDYEADGDDVIDSYWRSVDRKLVKAVVLSVLLHAVILLSTISGILRTMGLSPKSILALGGVSGLAFGLASQNLVGNFMSGILLIVNRQFTVGDIIETNKITGKVKSMGWTFIELQRGDDLVMLPNSKVVGTTVVQIGHFAEKGGAAESE